jgi:hypothetical protein
MNITRVKKKGHRASLFMRIFNFFSKSRMMEVVTIVKNFIRESGIHLNSKKRNILKSGKDSQESFPRVDDFTQEIHHLEWVDDNHVIRYLEDSFYKG